MEDKIINILMSIVIVFVMVSIIAIGVCIYQEINNKCYSVVYIEYPCEGATHYARLHRNQNIGCEKTKKICEE